MFSTEPSSYIPIWKPSANGMFPIIIPNPYRENKMQKYRQENEQYAGTYHDQMQPGHVGKSCELKKLSYAVGNIAHCILINALPSSTDSPFDI